MYTFLSILAIVAVVYHFVYFRLFFTPAHEDGGAEGILTTVGAVLSSAFIVFYEWKYSFIPGQYTDDGFHAFIIVAFLFLTFFLAGFLLYLIREEINIRKSI